MSRRLLTLCCLLVGCYASYTGTYSVGEATQQPLATFANIDERLYEAIRPLGFQRMDLPDGTSDYSAFLKASGDHPATEGRIPGDDARITIAVGLGDLVITVRDWTYSDETDFMRSLKRRIERQLEEQYGVVGIQFERSLEFPLPN